MASLVTEQVGEDPEAFPAARAGVLGPPSLGMEALLAGGMRDGSIHGGTAIPCTSPELPPQNNPEPPLGLSLRNSGGCWLAHGAGRCPPSRS